jgi:anti-sigma factor RsiW
METHQLTCQELVELVTEYLEGSLPPEERLAFEQHIVYCGGCAAYLNQMRETIRLTGSLREDDLEPQVRDALLAAFRGWKGR